jgi:hypothetical protein
VRAFSAVFSSAWNKRAFTKEMDAKSSPSKSNLHSIVQDIDARDARAADRNQGEKNPTLLSDDAEGIDGHALPCRTTKLSHLG